MIRIAEPRIGEAERRAVLDVLASGRLTNGPYTQRLEAAFAREVSGTAEAVAVSSGTAALHLALLAHDIGPGDEVITTPFSFQATANMVLAVGARPVFVDVALDGNIDPSLIEAALTSRTKALLPVHLYGRLCDMPALRDIAARHHLALIEDAAQAHGAAYMKSRRWSDVRGDAPSAGSGVPPATMPDAAQAHGAAYMKNRRWSDVRGDAPLAGSGVPPATMPDAAQAHGAAYMKRRWSDVRGDAPSAGSGVPPATMPDAAQAHGASSAASAGSMTSPAKPDGISPSTRGGRGSGGEEAPSMTNETSKTPSDGSPSPSQRRGGQGGEVTPTACFSLYATKNLTAGEGGVITTDDGDLARRLRRLRQHGEDGRYESVELGYNYRITEIGAALALSQLEALAQANDRRRANAAFLTRHLEGVETPEPPADPASHVWHQYTVRLTAGRDRLQAHLRDRGIEAMVYYPMTLPAQKLYRDLGYDDAPFPVARRLAAEVLSLPVHPGLSEGDLQAIVNAVNEWTAVPSAGKALPR